MIIELSKGMVAEIDAEDFGIVSQHSWHVSKKANDYYAQTAYRETGKLKHILMHRLIMGCASNQEVHHKDGNTLNNRKDNLEVCSKAVNLYRRRWGQRK